MENEKVKNEGMKSKKRLSKQSFLIFLAKLFAISENNPTFATNRGRNPVSMMH
ncbi:MAG: hypothetical protein IJ537_03990 [Bacteroidaceae bacterium]|nr:hypothetical protein [Bacteroidaceae bacterium]